jgi:cytochrome P450
MGAPLARLEAKIAIGTLLRRLPRLHLLNDRPPARRVAAFMLNLRTFQSLPIAFGPDQA